MARILNSLGAGQNVDAGAIEGRSKRVCMQRLAPLVVGLLVAMAAVGRIRKGVRLKKVVAFHGSITGTGDVAFGEGEVVCLAHFVRVGLACVGLIVARIFRPIGTMEQQERDCAEQQR